MAASYGGPRQSTGATGMRAGAGRAAGRSLADIGRSQQQGPVNYSGMGTGQKAMNPAAGGRKIGTMGMGPSPSPVGLPIPGAQTADRGFRAMQPGMGNAYAAQPVQPNTPLVNQNNGARDAGYLGTSSGAGVSGVGRDRSVMDAFNTLNGGGPTSGYGGPRFNSQQGPTRRPNITPMNRTPGQIVGDGARNVRDNTRNWISNHYGVGGGGEGFLGSDMGTADYSGIPGADNIGKLMAALGGDLGNILGSGAGSMADNLNKKFRPGIDEYFDNFSNLDPLADASKRLLDHGVADGANQAARDQMYSDITTERDRQSRQLMSQAYGGGRSLGGNAMGQAFDSSQRALAAGNRGLAQDEFGRMLSATTAGAGIAGDRARQINDILNQKMVDPSEILAVLGEALPEMFGSGLEFLGGALPGGS